MAAPGLLQVPDGSRHPPCPALSAVTALACFSAPSQGGHRSRGLTTSVWGADVLQVCMGGVPPSGSGETPVCPVCACPEQLLCQHAVLPASPLLCPASLRCKQVLRLLHCHRCLG